MVLSTDKMKLKVVGNGGAVNYQLPHNSILLDDHFLVDCPHDIIHSLQTLEIDTSAIDSIYISHFHGDHTFGFPFLVLDKWIGIQKGQSATRISVYGPKNIRAYLFRLTEMAFSKNHPCYAWLEENSDYLEVNEGTEIIYREFTICVFKMEHIKNTFGFTIFDKLGVPRFSYMTDTKWCPRIASELRKRPRVILIDMNGGSSGIHMSYEEVVQNCIKITKRDTQYLGTHLAKAMRSTHEMINIVSQGDELVL